MAKDDKIPLYTRLGAKITAILMLLLTLMILKNCVESFFYGTTTDSETVEYYYKLGFADGEKKAHEGEQHKIEEPQHDNLLLIKAYRRGFRDGWDSGRQQEIQQDKPLREE